MSHEVPELYEAPTIPLDTILDLTPEETVAHAYMRGLQQLVGADVLAHDFSSVRTQARLPQFVDRITPTVIGAALQFEELRSDRPLHELLGRSAFSGVIATDLRPTEQLINGIRSQIAHLPPDFLVPLDDYHATLKYTGFLEIARRIHYITDSGAHNWVDAAYGVLKGLLFGSNTDRFEYLSVPGEHGAALALVCFLPNDCRNLTGRLIANSTLYAQIDQQLGHTMTTDEEYVMRKMKYFLKSDILSEKQWVSLNVGDSTKGYITLMKSNAQGCIDSIYNIVSANRAPRVVQAWMQSAYELDTAVRQAEFNSDLFRWAPTDVVSCFERFVHKDLQRVLLAKGIEKFN